MHPDPGHDIPGVRSLPQLKQTKLFHPEEYDQLVEVTNREAFDMCLRLTREESLIAGPSSALDSTGEAPKLLPKERQMNTLVENSRNPHNTLAVEDLQAELQNSRPLVVDVRSPEAYTRQHVAGAVNIPAESLKDRKADLPQDLEAPIVTVCTRGNASISGMLVLQSLGYRNVKSLNGGTTAWSANGLPVE